MCFLLSLPGTPQADPHTSTHLNTPSLGSGFCSSVPAIPAGQVFPSTHLRQSTSPHVRVCIVLRTWTLLHDNKSLRGQLREPSFPLSWFTGDSPEMFAGPRVVEPAIPSAYGSLEARARGVLRGHVPSYKRCWHWSLLPGYKPPLTVQPLVDIPQYGGILS